ncbi:hypothetical protein TPE_2060 [Treponema pedis str. T A4]|uniref:Uncharacterized protein n=1 Tax=Treponema pedis str. T A4 TaxID=1291379 RepID=S6A8W4_9SPIR|nr:hypothetical protein TPE_2060 [Treponema pedis str. T A4]
MYRYTSVQPDMRVVRHNRLFAEHCLYGLLCKKMRILGRGGYIAG